MKWIKIAGLALLTYLLVNQLGLPFGLLWACAVAMVVLG